MASHTGALGRIRVLIIDDHTLFRQGLRALLAAEPLVDVAGDCSTVAEALRLLDAMRPDVILLDVKLGAEDGIEAIEPLKVAAPDAEILLVTGHCPGDRVSQALVRGARGIVRKDRDAQSLLRAIRKVRLGEVWLEPTEMVIVLEGLRTQRAPAVDPTADRIASLTRRERSIVERIGLGESNRRIAAALGISEKTVRNHLTVVFDKLDVDDRLGLAIFSYQHGLAALPRPERRAVTLA